jgi:hypothetical protein
MAEEIHAFRFGDGAQDRPESSPQSGNGPLCGFAQVCLELTERLFDRVEVRRIGRQIDCHSVRGLNRLRDASDFVGCEVIHEDDVTAVERRGQTSFNIGAEDLSIERTIDHEGGHDCVMAQAGYQSDRLPMAMRNQADQTFTAGTTAVQPHHVGAGGRFINKHQPSRIKQKLLTPPAATCAGHVWPLLLRGAQALFF